MPSHPKIYHITPLHNLPQIAKAGVLWSDAKRIELRLECHVVGMPRIKQRRLHEIEVDCHAGTHVGEYVPFYFCPRSIMLYILYRGNHQDVTYRGGQRPLVHFQADLRTVVAWAAETQRPWAFTNCNAGARYVNFYANLAELDQVNWTAVMATDFRDPTIKEGKQAEFLMHDSFPWELVEKIGVIDGQIEKQVRTAIEQASHQPPVAIEPGWYY